MEYSIFVSSSLNIPVYYRNNNMTNMQKKFVEKIVSSLSSFFNINSINNNINDVLFEFPNSLDKQFLYCSSIFSFLKKIKELKPDEKYCSKKVIILANSSTDVSNLIDIFNKISNIYKNKYNPIYSYYLPVEKLCQNFEVIKKFSSYSLFPSLCHPKNCIIDNKKCNFSSRIDSILSLNFDILVADFADFFGFNRDFSIKKAINFENNTNYHFLVVFDEFNGIEERLTKLYNIYIDEDLIIKAKIQLFNLQKLYSEKDIQLIDKNFDKHMILYNELVDINMFENIININMMDLENDNIVPINSPFFRNMSGALKDPNVFFHKIGNFLYFFASEIKNENQDLKWVETEEYNNNNNNYNNYNSNKYNSYGSYNNTNRRNNRKDNDNSKKIDKISMYSPVKFSLYFLRIFGIEMKDIKCVYRRFLEILISAESENDIVKNVENYFHLAKFIQFLTAIAKYIDKNFVILRHEYSNSKNNYLEFRLFDPIQIYNDLKNNLEENMLLHLSGGIGSHGTVNQIFKFEKIIEYENDSYYIDNSIIDKNNKKLNIKKDINLKGGILFTNNLNTTKVNSNFFPKIIAEIVSLVPDGVIIYFNNYNILKEKVKEWSQHEVINYILNYKLIFIEEEDELRLAKILQAYKKSVNNGRGGLLLLTLNENSKYFDMELKGKYSRGIIFINEGKIENYDNNDYYKLKFDYYEKFFGIKENKQVKDYWFFNSIVSKISQKIADSKDKTIITILESKENKLLNKDYINYYPLWMRNILIEENSNEYNNIEDKLKVINNFLYE